MSIELNKPEEGGSSSNNQSIESLAFLLILTGMVLDGLNLLFRLWFNPLFILLILVGWCLLGQGQKRIFRIGISSLLLLIFIAGGFWGRPLFHVAGIIIGISELLSSNRLAFLLKAKPDASALVGILQKLRGLLKVFSIVALGAIILLVVLFFATREFMKQSETKTELNAIRAAVEKYKSDTNQYPESMAKLIGNDPLKREWLNDGWGTPYSFSIKNAQPEISSAGSDGTIGNGDDIK